VVGGGGGVLFSDVILGDKCIYSGIMILK